MVKNKSQKRYVVYVEKTFRKKRMSKACKLALGKAREAKRIKDQERQEEARQEALKAELALQQESNREAKTLSWRPSSLELPLFKNSHRISMRNTPGNLKPFPVVISEFKVRINNYMLERIDKQQKGQIADYPGDMRCYHIFTLGSSIVYRLLKNTHNLKSTHRRAYYHGSHTHGQYWEDIVEQWQEFNYKRRRYSIETKKPQVTGLSQQYPWIVATPDFIVQLKHKEHIFDAVLEVKSTKVYNEFKTIREEHKMQVQTALEVFNLTKGFLIMFLVNNETRKIKRQKIIMVERNPIFDNPDVIVTAYARYLQASLNKIYDCEFELSYLRNIAYALVQKKNPLANWQAYRIVLPRFSKCQYRIEEEEKEKRAKRSNSESTLITVNNGLNVIISNGKRPGLLSRS